MGAKNRSRVSNYVDQAQTAILAFAFRPHVTDNTPREEGERMGVKRKKSDTHAKFSSYAFELS